MKRRSWFFVSSLGLLMLVALWLWGPWRRPGPPVTLTQVGASAAATTFRLSNPGPHSIFLSDVFVEVKTATGWQPSPGPTPSDPRNIDAGSSKDILITPPGSNAPWRLRIAYGHEVRYPELLLLKADAAVSFRTWRPFSRLRPGNTWMGSNSVSSAELSN